MPHRRTTLLSGRPTVSDGKNEPPPLSDMLSSPLYAGKHGLREQFIAFLDDHQCLENYEFWRRCCDFNARFRGNTNGGDQWYEQAVILCNSFVVDGAPQQVNLDAETRTQILADVVARKGGPVFEHAQEKAFRLMDRDGYTRFVTHLAMEAEKIFTKKEKEKEEVKVQQPGSATTLAPGAIAVDGDWLIRRSKSDSNLTKTFQARTTGGLKRLADRLSGRPHSDSPPSTSSFSLSAQPSEEGKDPATATVSSPVFNSKLKLASLSIKHTGSVTPPAQRLPQHEKMGSFGYIRRRWFPGNGPQSRLAGDGGASSSCSDLHEVLAQQKQLSGLALDD